LITERSETMKQREHENTKLAARLREHYRNLSQFYEQHFAKDPVISFDTVRRAVYEDYRVNYPTLILLMDALGFSRAEIAEELTERGDTRYVRLIEPAGWMERDLSRTERQLVDDFRTLNRASEKLHHALLGFVRSLSGVSASLLEDPGNTPLHILAGAPIGASNRQQFEKLIGRLVKDKATDINVRNAHGATPLIYAAMAGNEEIALLLMERGADGAAEDQDGMTAFHYAHRQGLKKVTAAYKSKYPEVVMDYFVAGEPEV
jgi:ankyrin repeat protein